MFCSELHEINLQNNIFLREIRPRNGLVFLGQNRQIKEHDNKNIKLDVIVGE